MIKMDIYTKVLNRDYIPTAEEFNKLMHEHVEYEKLLKLQKQLKWFNGKVGNIDITDLETYINNKLTDVPEAVKIFGSLPHGQTTKIFK